MFVITENIKKRHVYIRHPHPSYPQINTEIGKFGAYQNVGKSLFLFLAQPWKPIERIVLCKVLTRVLLLLGCLCRKIVYFQNILA